MLLSLIYYLICRALSAGYGPMDDLRCRTARAPPPGEGPASTGEAALPAAVGPADPGRGEPAASQTAVVLVLLLVVAAAAYPLFISATASELVNSQLDRPTVTRFSGGITYEREELPFAKPAPGGADDGLLHERLDTMIRERAARSALLGPTLSNIVGGTVSVSPMGHPAQQRTGRLFAVEQALQHVRILEGTEGDGVWLPDLIASALHLGAGDRVRFTGREVTPSSWSSMACIGRCTPTRRSRSLATG